ncbi:hypothetical protein ACFP1Z_18325 [Streptomyces gamaensis]|uniref:Integral membrane protein n=1 Tax=Streptomyces gamaensis TaxID=1763542 RepID=A0ABW0Z6E7_9ACTN
MNAPGHVAPPRLPPGRAKAITIRVLLCVAAWCSAGVCAWAPLLRLAIVRRRQRDWAVFVVVLVVCLCCLVTIEERFAGTVINKVGGYTLLALLLTVVPYSLWNEIQHYRDLDRDAARAWQEFQQHRAREAAPAAPAAVPAPPPVPPAGPFGHPQGPGHRAAPQPQPLAQRQMPYVPPPQPAPRPDPFAETAHGPWHAAPQRPASQRIDEVRAELDELSALLRKEPRDHKEYGQ